MDRRDIVFVKNENGLKAVRKMTERLNPDSSVMHWDDKATVILLKREFSRSKRSTIGKIIYKPDVDNPELTEKLENSIHYSGNGY